VHAGCVGRELGAQRHCSAGCNVGKVFQSSRDSGCDPLQAERLQFEIVDISTNEANEILCGEVVVQPLETRISACRSRPGCGPYSTRLQVDKGGQPQKKRYYNMPLSFHTVWCHVSVPPTLRLGSRKMQQTRRSPPASSDGLLLRRRPVFPSSPCPAPDRRHRGPKKASRTTPLPRTCPSAIRLPLVATWERRRLGSVSPRLAMPSLSRP
jgi:hypothetical protein